MEYRNELISIIEEDKLLIEILTIVKNLNLNDCWIGAGFIRNKVWDVLHNQKTTEFNDIDVVFFDETNTSMNLESEIEQQLTKINPNLKWSVKNQARMHIRNSHSQYSNTENAISYWPETATAVAARLNVNDEIEILAPYGLNDLFHLIIRPTPNVDLDVFKERVADKKWEKKWKSLRLYNEPNF